MALDPNDLTWRNQSTASNDTAIVLVSAANVALGRFRNIQIFNRGANDGEFSIDGGASFVEIPADTVILQDNISITGAVQFKRITGASGGAGPTSGRIW